MMTMPDQAPVPIAGEMPRLSGQTNSVPLDQWRGLALLLVLVSHGFYFTGRVHGIGRVGVNLFFFISGVLVFRSLARRPSVLSTTLATRFWKRRLLRLYPALASYLVAMLLLTFLLQKYSSLPHSDVGSYMRSLPFALVYAINYWPPQGPMSQGHLWSLSCEMQFYLLAPLIFLVGGSTRLRRGCVWGALLAILLSVGVASPLLDHAGRYKYHFEVAVWPMMLGFCGEFTKSFWQRMPVRWNSMLIGVGSLVFAISLSSMLLGVELKKLVIASGAFVLMPCYLAYLSGREIPGVIGGILAWLGERTYSIYLWQQPFTICGYLPTVWHPAGAAAAVLAGGIWFRVFERPFLSAARKH